MNIGSASKLKQKAVVHLRDKTVGKLSTAYFAGYDPIKCLL